MFLTIKYTQLRARYEDRVLEMDDASNSNSNGETNRIVINVMSNNGVWFFIFTLNISIWLLIQTNSLKVCFMYIFSTLTFTKMATLNPWLIILSSGYHDIYKEGAPSWIL